jgi:hypothetical protein
MLAAICEEAFAAEVLESAAAAWAASVFAVGAVVAGLVVAEAGVVVPTVGVVAAGVVVAEAGVPGVVVPAVGAVDAGVVVAAPGVVVSGVPAAGVVAALEPPVEVLLLGAVVEELETGVALALEVDCRGINSAKKVVVVVPGFDTGDPEDSADCAASSWDHVIDPVLFVSMAAKAEAAWALLEPYAAANSDSLRRPSPLVSRRVKRGRLGDPGMLEACIPGSNWNRLLGLQDALPGDAWAPVVWLLSVAAFKFDEANSVPSISPSPFLSRTSKSWLAAAWLPLAPNLSTNSCRLIRPSPSVSILANSPGCEDWAGAALVVVWLTNRNASTPGAKLPGGIPVESVVAAEPEADGVVEAPELEDDDVVEAPEVAWAVDEPALVWIAAKFANKELNSVARSAIEGVLALLPLLDWVIVVNGVGKVVGDRLTVMGSILTGDCPKEVGQAACQGKNPDISVKNESFRFLVWANASPWSQHIGKICRERHCVPTTRCSIKPSNVDSAASLA